MADQKISALTAAATPLAGTEVLPIVQSSTTVKVSVDNLTNGRAVSAASLALSGSASAASVAVGAGLVGTPPYAFTGDLNTGMWSPAADAVAFSTAGAERLRITAAGDVGIANGTPARKLDINAIPAAANQLNGIRLDSAGSATSIAEFLLGTDGSGVPFTSARTGNDSNSFMTFFTGTGPTERLRLTAAGDFGLGTTTPTTGSMANTAVASAGIFATFRGFVASTSGVAVTIGTAALGGNETYIVSVAAYTGAPTVYSAVSIVSTDATVLRTTALQTASLMTISVSGTNIQATQASGTPQNIVFSIIRIA